MEGLGGRSLEGEERGRWLRRQSAEGARSARARARARARRSSTPLRRPGRPPPCARDRDALGLRVGERRMEGAPVRIRTEARAERLLAVHAIPEQSVVGFAESASIHIHIELTNSVLRIRMQIKY
jgi:hypothetical protein